MLSGAAAPAGGEVTNFVRANDGANYTFDVVPAADGGILVDVAADTARDLAGNNNTAADTYAIEYGGTPPHPVISAVQEQPRPTRAPSTLR